MTCEKSLTAKNETVRAGLGDGRSAPLGSGCPEAATHVRRRQSPTTPLEYLEQLPAVVLLDRLPVPALAIGLGGDLVYANPAIADLLGYDDASALTGRLLPTIMAGHGHHRARDCLGELAVADTVTHWRHVDGYQLHMVASKALLTRASDPLLLITLTDLTASLWSG